MLACRDKGVGELAANIEGLSRSNEIALGKRSASFRNLL